MPSDQSIILSLKYVHPIISSDKKPLASYELAQLQLGKLLNKSELTHVWYKQSIEECVLCRTQFFKCHRSFN